MLRCSCTEVCVGAVQRASCLLNSWSVIKQMFDFERNSPLWYVSPVRVLWVRHELLEDGYLLAGFSACLLSLHTVALLARAGEPSLEDCPAQGENGCPKTSPFLKEGGMHSLSECLFICTFTLWVYKCLTCFCWGKCKSRSPARVLPAPQEACWLPSR